jgi:hypothetical protein
MGAGSRNKKFSNNLIIIKMGKTNTIFAIILFAIAGCIGKKQSTDALITVDVTAGYPKTELILQDFMDVEYVVLETSDDFLTQGAVLAIGKKHIFAINRYSPNPDGDIFVFDRNGTGLRKINHKGRGPGEYSYINQLILDEENGEFFVVDSGGRILVYDLQGNFKRSFKPKDDTVFIHIFNYDNHNFICLGCESVVSARTVSTYPFFIVSKHDGTVQKEVHIPLIEGAPGGVQVRRTEDGAWILSVISSFFHPLIPYHGDWIMTMHSSDTVFRYQPDGSRHPFIVRTPPSQSMKQKALLFPGILTDRYYFMIALKEDPGAEPPWGKISNEPVMAMTNLVYDIQEGSIFESIVYNGDYADKKQVSMFQKTAENREIAFWLNIEADKLFEANKNGELKGNLKDIAAGLEEDSNPVIMLVKHKK